MELYNNPEAIHYTLGTLGAFIGPLFGVLIADYYLVHAAEGHRGRPVHHGPGRAATGSAAGYNPNAVWATVAAGVPAMASVLLPKMLIDLGVTTADYGWISDYSWFIGCGLGFVALIALERRTPRIVHQRAGRLMAHIKVINPNTTWSMTETIGRCARAVAAPATVITAVNPTMGPASIESHYDEALAVPGLLAEIAAGERDGVDGYVIACFGDPGLDAARELAAGPVVGIAEAAMHAATFLGRGFSVVTTLGRTVGRAWDLAREYGFGAACRGVHACEIPVLDLDDPGLRRPEGGHRAVRHARWRTTAAT